MSKYQIIYTLTKTIITEVEADNMHDALNQANAGVPVGYKLDQIYNENEQDDEGR